MMGLSTSCGFLSFGAGSLVAAEEAPIARVLCEPFDGVFSPKAQTMRKLIFFVV